MRPLVVTALVAWPLALSAQPANYDAFLQSAGHAGPPSTNAGRVTAHEARLGVPTFFWADRDASAERSGGAATPLATEPEAAARQHLRNHAHLYRVPPSFVSQSRLTDLHDTSEGAIVATFAAEVHTVPVFRDRVHVVMRRDLSLVALSGYLSPHIVGGQEPNFELEPAAAIAISLFDLSGELVDLYDLNPSGTDSAGFQTFSLEPFAKNELTFPTPARTRPVFYPGAKRLISAYHVELDVVTGPSQPNLTYAYVISAEDGEVLFRKNLTEHQDFTYRVYAGADGLPWDGPMGNGENPHPTGQPGPTPRTWLPSRTFTIPHGPISTLDPWLEAGATETRGNNVDAYVDANEPDGFSNGDHRGAITSTATFDHPYDPTVGAHVTRAQRDAALTNLFYVVNYLHDWFYDIGLDEQAGNAQQDNYGRGGADGDRIVAQAQDYSNRNNAAMATPSDGRSPRMILFRYDGVDEVSINVTSPAAIGGLFVSGISRFGPSDFNVSGNIVVALDGSGETTDACQSPLTNSSSVAGNIALIARGNCNFNVKVRNVQAAGAIGAIISNNRVAAVPPTIGGTASDVTIPVTSITQEVGDDIRAQLMLSPVSVELRRVDVPDMDPSFGIMTLTHEFTHYVTNRLIGNAAGLNTIQSRGMGEGWSDFAAMLMSSEAEDLMRPNNQNWTGSWAESGYTSRRGTYFGVRRVPYTVDRTKNALTFKHIGNGESLPANIPTAFGLNGDNNAEVHATGEVWATMLWECYVSLLRDPRYTFDEAKRRMARYMVASYKITPNAPTFVEARDAILAAVAAENMTDFRMFWTAFASRGLGFSAVAPPRTATDNNPVVESFDVGNAVEIVDTNIVDTPGYCDRDGVLDPGERGRLFVRVRNSGIDTLGTVTGTITTASSGVLLQGQGLFSVGPVAPFEVVTATLTVELATTVADSELELVVGIDAQGVLRSDTATVTYRINRDDVPSSTTTDDVEAIGTPWTSEIDMDRADTTPWRREIVTGPDMGAGVLDQRWFGENDGFPADSWVVSPPLVVTASGAFGFSFSHRYAIEDGWDGGRIELTRDGGMNWEDIGDRATPGYDRALRANTPTPFSGEEAFTGESPNWPDTNVVDVDLGATYAGMTVQVRFRMGTDWATRWWGWEVDDIRFYGIDNTPFSAAVNDRMMCINRPPIADAGPDFSVDERTMVVLDPSRSTDPDNDTLMYTWSQVDGVPVMLVDGLFIAPEVTEDTPLTFSLIAADAEFMSAPDDVVVTVRHVNRPPFAFAGMDMTVDERSQVILQGRGTDLDGDSVTFEWTQIGGPGANLPTTNTATLTFVAPEVTETTTMTLALTTSDGTDTSTPSQVTLTIQNVNRAPTAMAGADQTVDTGATVQLNGQATDPDGDSVTLSWTEVPGPTVILSGRSLANPTFTAPDTEGVLQFELTASDGDLTSAPATVTITVREGNTAPTITQERVLEVVETESATITVTAVDADNDPLTFEWSQTAGPQVELTGAGPSRTFVAPEVNGTTELQFEVIVRDGRAEATTIARAFVRDRPPVSPDAGVTMAMDATPADATTTQAEDGGGCSCSTNQTRRPTDGLGLWAILAGGLLLRRLRRR